MKSDMIVGLIVFIVVLALEILVSRADIPFLRWMRKWERQAGAKAMVAFLCGFIVFILLTHRMPNPWQKIPVIIAALLLIWANLFLGKKGSE